MNNILTFQHKEDMRLALSQHTFSLETFVAKLVAEGYDKTDAYRLVAAEFKEYKTELFAQKMKENESEEAKKIAYGVIFVVSVIGPVFHFTSGLWYTLSFLIAGAAGYYGYKSKPIAGIGGAIVLSMAFPFAYHIYFAGRRTFINIELLIPMIMAAVPAFIIFLILSKGLYSDDDNN
jgi:hypothetical protein